MSVVIITCIINLILPRLVIIALDDFFNMYY